MSKKIIANSLVVVAVLGALIVPGYLEYARGYRQAKEFSDQAKERQIESKVMRWSHDFSNPFTWGRGIPTFVASRKPQSDGNRLMLYSNFTDESKEMNKALVWANCGTRQVRLVTQGSYENVLKESGYDTLGNKLPAWDDADYAAMLGAMIQTPPKPANQSLFFDVVCRWDKYSSM